MYYYSEKLSRIDKNSMILIYTMDALSCLAYIYLMWFENYRLGEYLFFLVFYSFSYGISIMLCMLLIIAALKNSIFGAMPLLIIFIVILTLKLLACIAYTALFGAFWSDGYVYMMFQLVLIVVSGRRYLTLREWRPFVEKELRKEDSI